MRHFVLGLIVAATLAAPRMGNAAQWSLWPAAEIDETYDNNVKMTPTDRKGDFLTVEALGATLESDSPTRSFFLTYSTLMLEHVSYPGQDRFGLDHYFGVHDFEKLSAETTLSISESFLVGDAASGFLLTNGSTPIGSQLMQSLLLFSTSVSNSFAMDLSSRYSGWFTWSANAHQNFFSVLSSSSTNKYSFNEGGTLAGDWLVTGHWTVGLGYDFEDYRFSNSSVPTTESNWPQARLAWGKDTPFSLSAEVGPVISFSSSGITGTTSVPAQTKVDAAYLVAAAYTGRRLTLKASAGQVPMITAGFGGFATSQTYSGLVQYKLTRHTTLFANSGYYSFSGSGTSGHVVSYTCGISHRLTKFITLNAQFLGYQSLASGSSVGTLVAVPGRTAVTDLFLIGLTFTPRPFMWTVL